MPEMHRLWCCARPCTWSSRAAAPFFRRLGQRPAPAVEGGEGLARGEQVHTEAGSRRARAPVKQAHCPCSSPPCHALPILTTRRSRSAIPSQQNRMSHPAPCRACLGGLGGCRGLVGVPGARPRLEGSAHLCPGSRPVVAVSGEAWRWPKLPEDLSRSAPATPAARGRARRAAGPETGMPSHLSRGSCPAGPSFRPGAACLASARSRSACAFLRGRGFWVRHVPALPAPPRMPRRPCRRLCPGHPPAVAGGPARADLGRAMDCTRGPPRVRPRSRRHAALAPPSTCRRRRPRALSVTPQS